MDEMNEIWTKALAILKEEIAEAPFKSFVKPIKPIKLDFENLSFTLAAENDYSKERLNDRHISPIESALRDVCGVNLKANFVSAEALAQHSERPIDKTVVPKSFNSINR